MPSSGAREPSAPGAGMTGTRRVGSVVGIGWDGCVVVFLDGSKMIGSRMSRSKGQMPVAAKADIIVDFVIV